MPLHGKLILNGADYAPFNLYGVGVFMAHSEKALTEIKELVAQSPTMVHYRQVNTGSLIVVKVTGSPKRKKNFMTE